MNKDMVFFYIGKINGKLSKYGYSHSLGYWMNGQRFQLFFQDENKYHVYEFGNLTIEKAILFLTGYYNGLNVGLLDFDPPVDTDNL